MNLSTSSSRSKSLVSRLLLPAVWLFTGVAFFALVLHIGHFSADSPVRSARWLYPVFVMQDAEMGQDTEQDRIILMGGSNVLFGFDGHLLEELTGRKVINIGAHAGFSVSHYASRLSGKIKPGDLVIASFEHTRYAEPEHSQFEQTQTLVWLQKYYDGARSWQNYTNILEAKSEDILRVLAKRILASPDELNEMSGLIDENTVTGCAHSLPPAEQYYDQSRVNRHCIVYATDELSGRGAEMAESYVSPYPAFEYTDATGDSLEELKSIIVDQGGRLLLTWPSMMDTPTHAANDAELLDLYNTHAMTVEDAGFRFICDPQDHWFPPEFFLDTEYHLNGWGASHRAFFLASCLATEEATKPLSPAVNETEEMAMIARIVGSRINQDSEAFRFEPALRQLAKARDWILDYRQTNTRYPGNDEVMSALESILDDRVRYQTDGSDYKLTYSDAQTCLDITKFAPALVDVAGCPTFGFWSVGAKDW